jgi:hypothetical protein
MAGIVVKRAGLAILFFTLSLTSKAFAAVPPDYIELTSVEMKSWGFKVKIQRDDANSSIDLSFPKSMLRGKYGLAPHSTEVIVKNPAGEVIARTANWVADSGLNSIVTSYDHKVSDLSVSVTYACKRNGNSECYGATAFSISSVSQFINANPDVVNVRPKCRNVTSNIIDCS